MPLDRSKIKKIFLISLTNIGDVVLTFPVIDILKRDFPEAKLSIMIGPKAESLLKGNPYLDKVHIFNKHQSGLKMLHWIWQLRQERFDAVIDLRNTAIPFMLGSKHKTPLVKNKNKDIHMRDKHLQRLRLVHDYDLEEAEQKSFFISDEDKKYVKELMGDFTKFMVIAPGAADQAKRWIEEGFAEVADRIIKEGLRVVFLGDQNDAEIAQRIIQKMQSKGINLCGQTTLIQSAELIKHAQYMLTNDSAPMHLASYLNTPTLALFGPTPPKNYGPWSTKSTFIQGNDSTMQSIKSEEVLSVLQSEYFIK